MRLVVTGGGTGGHVYPALEVAAVAQHASWDVHYVGSIRGMEARACAKEGVSFTGFDVEPIYRLTTMRGLRAAAKLMRATSRVGTWLDGFRADCLFSSGGYASAACVSAAKRRGIPYVLHEQNAVVGRSVGIFAKEATAVGYVFESAEQLLKGCNAVRTGMPIRAELRSSAQGKLGWSQGLRSDAPILLVMGGSQGSEALNDAALATAVRMAGENIQWLHITGERFFESTQISLKKLAVTSHYEVRAFLSSEELASALFSSSLAICRSGAGTLSELAAYRKPSVLVPYPNAYGQHQLHNAKEFEAMGAATVLEQVNLQASTLQVRILAWLHEEGRREAAALRLAEWDRPDAAKTIFELLRQAAARQAN